MTDSPSLRHYFVDESGDGVIFNRKGHVMVGRPGCQRFFMLGLLDVIDPDSLQVKLDDLRESFLNDPYFKNVPSLSQTARKTALGFHAKNDLPEIRREVFRLLLNQELRFFALVKDMKVVLDYVTRRNEMDSEYRYHPNELYDLTVRMLFKQRLHQHDRYRIIFARRGNRDRTKALKSNLNLTRTRFCQRYSIDREAEIEVIPQHTRENAGLQAVDYFLWALQRCFEKGEARFIEYMWPKISLVHDVDDARRAGYGEYYTRKKPLDQAAINQRSRI